ncbi:MAG: hypothetical protein IJL52_02420 [Clostridia bacterium]|nr:hypothetical protein [Clostridia bacterium]
MRHKLLLTGCQFEIKRIDVIIFRDRFKLYNKFLLKSQFIETIIPEKYKVFNRFPQFFVNRCASTVYHPFQQDRPLVVSMLPNRPGVPLTLLYGRVKFVGSVRLLAVTLPVITPRLSSVTVQEIQSGKKAIRVRCAAVRFDVKSSGILWCLCELKNQ